MTIGTDAQRALADPPPGARQLARGITATWWYTVSAVLFLQLFLVLVWTLRAMAAPSAVVAPLVVAGGGALWWGSTLLLVTAYRHRGHGDRGLRTARVLLPLAVAFAYGMTTGVLTDSWLLAAAPLAGSLALLDWPRGVRFRLVTLVTAVLFVLTFVDAARGALGGPSEWMSAAYGVLFPAMAVSSLWWWDVLVTLDTARASEARLAATQERLRVATDVHDLQGHHLQVIALQLELAERLMPSDPDAALEQLRLARTSVDEARQGTRDLATRFRSVPLGDEVANARDLLRAAGLEVVAEIADDADDAPSSALGPVIRETTTNVLRHGAGRRARLSLRHGDGEWRYEIANDVDPAAPVESMGSGLDGVRRRLAEVGGVLELRDAEGEFLVVATVPEGSERAEGAA